MRPSRAFLALALAAAPGLSACALPSDASAPGGGAESARPATQLPAPPKPVEAAVCLDGTLSLSRAVVRRQQEVVADALSRWPAGGSQAASGPLSMRIRKIDGDSYGAAEVAHLAVPAVPAVPAEPAADASDFLQVSEKIDTLRAQRPGQQTRAKAAAAASAQRVRQLDLTAYSSEIVGCLSAGVQTLSPAAARRLVLWSDLDQGRPAQLAGALSGVPLLVVHECGGDAGLCAQQETEFRAAVARLGGRADVVRPERAAAVMLPFLQTGAVK